MIHLVVTLDILPARLNDFLRLATAHRDASVEEEGCLQFDLMRSGTQFALYGVWLSDEALAQHRLTPHYLRWRAEVPGMEARPHDREQYRSVRTVFANGCLDGPDLHAGHLLLLREAAEQGDLLTVALNSDDSVRRLKGPSRPICPEAARVARLLRVPCVGHVVVFDTEGELRSLLRSHCPDVLVKGDDWRGKDITGAEFCGRLHFVERIPGLSTSSIATRQRAGLPSTTGGG